MIDTADFNDDTKLGKGKDKVDTLSKLVTAFTKMHLIFPATVLVMMTFWVMPMNT